MDLRSLRQYLVFRLPCTIFAIKWHCYGSGFPKIITAWKETNWDKPELKNKIELDEME